MVNFVVTNGTYFPTRLIFIEWADIYSGWAAKHVKMPEAGKTFSLRQKMPVERDFFLIKTIDKSDSEEIRVDMRKHLFL